MRYTLNVSVGVGVYLLTHGIVNTCGFLCAIGRFDKLRFEFHQTGDNPHLDEPLRPGIRNARDVA